MMDEKYGEKKKRTKTNVAGLFETRISFAIVRFLYHSSFSLLLLLLFPPVEWNIREKWSSSCSDKVNMWWSVLFCLLDYCCWSLNFKFAERFIYILCIQLFLDPVGHQWYTVIYYIKQSFSLCPIPIRLSICFVVFLLLTTMMTMTMTMKMLCVCAIFLLLLLLPLLLPPKPFFCLRATLAKMF